MRSEGLRVAGCFFVVEVALVEEVAKLRLAAERSLVGQTQACCPGDSEAIANCGTILAGAAKTRIMIGGKADHDAGQGSY